MSKTEDQLDYERFLAEIELSHAQMEAGNAAALVVITPLANVRVDESAIAGRGAFAKIGMRAGDYIAMAKIGKWWTLAGRYINHAKEPNTRAVLLGNGNCCVTAMRSITAGDELTANYRQVKEVLEDYV